MEKLIEMKMAIMENAASELSCFEMGLDEKSPCWLVLARKAKYEFMQRVFLEMQNISFDEAESLAILEEDDFLARCWEIWNQIERMEGEATIEEAMEGVLMELMEEKCCVVFII